MQAAYINQTGAANVIHIGELPNPEIQQNDVLVKVEGVSVNHVDTYVRSGGFQTALAFPHVIGRDMVGEVVAVGSAVDAFKRGDIVWTNSMGYDGRQGVASSLTAVPSERLFALPKGVDHLQALASVHSAATAAIVLTDVMQAQVGQSILIEGAAGHVGTKFIQLAHEMGLKVLTTSNPADFDHLLQLGSQMAYAYRLNITEDVHQVCPAGVDHIIDTSGNVGLQDNLKLLAQAGDITLIAAPKGNQFSFDVRQFYTQQQQIKGFVISHATLPQLQRGAQIINDAFSRHLLLDDHVRTLPLADAAKAHAMLENGQDKGQRLILVP